MNSDFAADAAFLQSHTDIIVLTNRSGQGKIAVVPAWQGRVMTSTAGGDGGLSFGWMNHDRISSGKPQPHINVFGGEDRVWLGPEGGQFSLFFAKGASFEIANWFTPAPVDSMPYDTVSQSADSAAFAARFMLTNYSGTRFDVKLDRVVRILEPADAWQNLGLPPVQDVNLVAFQSENKITNAGPLPWNKATGLLSIWILGQFRASPGATVMIPIKSARAGRDAAPRRPLPPNVNAVSEYFGNIPPERLAVKNDVVFFKADGMFRSKIGIHPTRSRKVMGSYDPASRVLTLVQFSQPDGVTDYVNSLLPIQDNPYGGDVANSYNDGPPVPGAKAFGPYYELETSSPAASPAPGGSMSHIHRTVHLTGPETALDKVARHALGISLRTNPLTPNKTSRN